MINAQAFGAPAVANQPAKLLTVSTHVVNANVIHNKAIVPAAALLSYDNPGGKGNRTAIITITSNAALGGGTLADLVNGSFANSMWWSAGQKHADVRLRRGQSRPHHRGQALLEHGRIAWVVEWRGSPNNSNWTDLSAAFNFAAGLEGFVMGNLTGNVTAWRFYQLFQASGTTSSNPYHRNGNSKSPASS